MADSVSPADEGTTELASLERTLRAGTLVEPGIFTGFSAKEARILLAEYDRRGAELEELRAAFTNARAEIRDEEVRGAALVAQLDEARAELASTRRELSESLVARARLDKLATASPEQSYTYAVTTGDGLDPHGSISLVRYDGPIGSVDVTCKCGAWAEVLNDTQAREWWELHRSAPPLARSVPSVTAQTEERNA